MKSRINIILTLVFATWMTMGASAQSLTFSLEEAKQFAMENSYVLRNTNSDITIAEKKVWETITIGLPQVSGAVDYTNNIMAAKTPFPVAIIPKDFWPVLGIPDDAPLDGVYPISFMQKFNSNVGLTVNQMLFDGSYIVGVGSSQIYLNLARQAHEKAEIDIREAVTQAYYMVLIGEEYKKVMEDNLVISKKRFDETKVFYENGFREEQDVSQMKILLKNAENEVNKAEREITVAKVVLKYAMGMDLDSEIVLRDNLSQFLDPITVNNNEIPFDFNQHIDYRLASTNFQVSEKLLNLEKVQYLPRLNAFYNYSRNTFTNDANVFKSNWYPSSMFGLQMSLQIFNSGLKRSKVQQARIELDKAEVQRRLTEITLQKDYLTAVAEKESALAQYKNDLENRDLAESIKGKTQIKFENGISGSAELTLVEGQYLEAYGALVNSIMTLLQSDLKLKKAVGKL